MSNEPDDHPAARDGHLAPAPPPDLVPPPRTRPTRQVVAHLLGTPTGTEVELTEHHLIEDVDGSPAGVETRTRTAAFARPTLEALGWTEGEWNDARITE